MMEKMIYLLIMMEKKKMYKYKRGMIAKNHSFFKLKNIKLIQTIDKS